MRQFSFAIGRVAKLMPPADQTLEQPCAGPPVQQDPLRRRLEDAVEDVFHSALRGGDLASAEELLGVMEAMHIRARVRFQHERKGTPLMIDRARNELTLRKTRRRPGRADVAHGIS